jgi:AAA domain
VNTPVTTRSEVTDDLAHSILDEVGARGSAPRPVTNLDLPPGQSVTPGADESGEGERSAWRPVDLTDVLAGRYRPVEPTVGCRDDGVGLFYPGRMHSVAAESEAGKTWLMLAACATELAAGRAALYVDFEDDEGGVVTRLLALGADRRNIADRFAYFRPDAPITTGDNRSHLGQALGDLHPTLAVLDGVTEAMTMHSLDPLSNRDVAEFGRILPRWITGFGAAVVTLDHVVKNGDARGRYALGAVHKLNGLNGAAYTLEARNPFGVGVTGRSGLFISKDRPGQLRRHAANSKAGMWFADLVGTSHDQTSMEISIATPLDPGQFKPTALMTKVADYLNRYPGASVRAIVGGVTGNAKYTQSAINWLADDGYVKIEKVGNAHLHTLIKPFPDPS